MVEQLCFGSLVCLSKYGIPLDFAVSTISKTKRLLTFLYKKCYLCDNAWFYHGVRFIERIN